MKCIVTVMALVLMFTTTCFAALRVVGKGDNMAFDPSNFPPNMKADYEIMKVKCIKCHTLERTVVAITTGVAPITGQPFDRNATKAYGVKMMRKPDSGMNKQQVKQVVELMNWLLDEAAK
jgi:L-fucose mutarotase/ribose pyranase (RbsD/FucU family)